VLARPRRSAFGLRGRIVGAVLISTLVTLGVAAVVLLPRLEASLRNATYVSLRSDVETALKDGEVTGIGRIDYRLLPDLQIPALRKTVEYQQAAKDQRILDADLNALAQDVGASEVALIGYIDASGHGQVVAPGYLTHPRDVHQVDSLDDVRAAYLADGKPYLSFFKQQLVRAAILLRGDDAVLVIRRPINDIPYSVSAVRRSFEIAALAGLLLTALLAIPLAATLVRRLQTLREAALQVAAEGTGAEVPVDRARDEVGDLSRSFAIMNRRLRQQEEARRAFVATASHELRTPLASLDGMLELLADDLKDPTPDLEDAEGLLERARVQSRRLGRLAADLLDLSRIDADVQLRSEPVELAEIARAVIAEFELAMEERGVGAELREATERVWALGDPGSIARIVRILLDNALRIAPRGSDIQIELTTDPLPTLRVHDCGPGVAPEERAVIFDRFQRGRDTGGEAGFGLGLAIGRELAERMGGSLELADTGSAGATFVLTLLDIPAVEPPVRRPSLAARQH
jgi:signal transduction histidine kinase